MAEAFTKGDIETVLMLAVKETWDEDLIGCSMNCAKKYIQYKGNLNNMGSMTGKERESVSVILLTSSSGTKKKPWIVFKQPSTKNFWKK